MSEFVILVDENNNQLGTEEKIKAHELGLLHRAFSVFVFNEKGELLLQQRADGKYHCPGFWSNTTCSHPREGESALQAAHRRLQEEMGFDCPLQEIGHVIYNIPFDNGLTEHEYDFIFAGNVVEKEISIQKNPVEVQDYKRIPIEELKKDIIDSPQKYTPWLKIILEKINKNFFIRSN